MISHLNKAKVIVSIGVGFDHIDLEAAAEKGIPVCNVPDYGTEEVADTAVAMIMAHHRKIGLYNHFAAAKGMEWDWRVYAPITRTRNTQAGIIGLGRIGTAVALRLKAMNFKTAFFDPYLPRGVEKSLGIHRYHDMMKLVSESDIVTIHTPLSEETTGMVNSGFLRSMKQRSILVNTARGRIFKSADILMNYMKLRKEARIATDVWPDEPPVDHPLLKAWRKNEAWLGDRLIVTPHSAFYSSESAKEIRAFAAEIVKTVLSGGKPYNLVNRITD
jgi:D-3-phosphoglycerate dehydrogenase